MRENAVPTYPDKPEDGEVMLTAPTVVMAVEIVVVMGVNSWMDGMVVSPWSSHAATPVP